MIKTIQKIGNSHGIILDKAYLDHMGVREGSKVNVTISGSGLSVIPEDNYADDETVNAVMEKVLKKYDKAFRALAK